jgi:hypothetical protein
MAIMEKLMQEKEEKLGENCKGGFIPYFGVFFMLCSH